MKSKLLFSLLCLAPIMSANAAVPYRVQQIVMPRAETESQSFADRHRFYIGGAYNFALWNSYTDSNDVHVSGKNAAGFDAIAGIRVWDTFRVEGNYINTSAKYTAFKLKNNIGMINAIFDARIDNMFRLFYKQHMVPYVGIGGGLSWNSVKNDRGIKINSGDNTNTSLSDAYNNVLGIIGGSGLANNTQTDNQPSYASVHIDDKVSPVVAAMAGIGIELGEYFTIDLGYRYLYMFSPKFDGIKDLNPTANQFRAGVRINF